MSPVLNTIRVLHIDDDSDFADLTAAVLEREEDRFEVETATTPAAGLDRLDDADVDCIVCDHDMPKMSGIEVLETVREERPELPFIIFTGKGSEKVASKAISRGATDYLQKGGGTEQFDLLANRVHNAVENYRSQRQLARQREEYRQLFERAPVMFAIFRDEEGEPVFEECNERFARKLGYEPGALRGRSVREFFTDESVAQAIEGDGFQRALAGEFTTGERQVETANGDILDVLVRAVPRTDATGEVTGVLALYVDMTEQRRREDAIKALHDVAIAIQTEETVEAVCERTVSAAADILEFKLCTVLRRDGEWLVPVATSEDAPPDGSRPMRLDQGLAGETYQAGTSQVIGEVTTADETDPAKESYQSGLSIPIGNHGVFQAVSTDADAFDEVDIELAELLISHTVTALDRIERERDLQRQNERLDQFASVVSHDLRNPLHVASARLELAAEESDSPHLEAVADSHERMEQLIDDLLTFARTGSDAIDRTPVDPSRLTDVCWRTLKREGATLVVETDRRVRADPDRLRQLLENLLVNALEHGGTEVSVTVGTLEDGFYVEDDGPGIPDADRGHVFDAGYSTTEEGTGFGLSIVQQVAEAHGWDIRVTEGSEGGARFEITGVEFVE